jgi:hypothetical protein
MGKGSGGWPSKTGNPSGGGRDNNAPGASYDDDDDSPGWREWSARQFDLLFDRLGAHHAPVKAPPAPSLSPEEILLAEAEMKAKTDAIFNAARTIRTAREDLSVEAAKKVELELRAHLTDNQNRWLIRVLQAPESDTSRMLRGR